MPTETPSAAASPGTFAQAGRALGDIKLHHSVFALPFAVLGAFLATPAGGPSAQGGEGGGWGSWGGWGGFAGQLGLVVCCMFFARTWAMLVNRLADRRIDAANPRTGKRALPSGAVTARFALLLSVLHAAGFAGCCGLFWAFFGNPWPLLLAVPTLGWIALYSFTKRFTALCHLFLGGALAASPIAASIAVRPDALAEGAAVWLLAGMVLFWVAGFDILYALQDRAFDRAQGLFSIPARLGAGRAVALSRVFHALAVAFLVGAAAADERLGALFAVGVGIVGVLLIWEHALFARRGLASLPMVFFTINGFVSCALGALGALDVALP